MSARKLRLYFQSHPIVVMTSQPIRTILLSLTQSGRLAKWTIELSEYDIDELVLPKVFSNTREPNVGKLGTNWEGPYRISEVVREARKSNQRSTWVTALECHASQEIPQIGTVKQSNYDKAWSPGRVRTQLLPRAQPPSQSNYVMAWSPNRVRMQFLRNTTTTLTPPSKTDLTSTRKSDIVPSI